MGRRLESIFSPEKWSSLFDEVIAAIPRAPGENEDQKKARLARLAGVSRATLSNILEGKPTRLIALDGWLRMIEAIPAKHAATKTDVMGEILQVIGLKLERDDHEA